MSDEVIWQVVNHQFCAYKIKTHQNQNFCRNEYNVTGLCTRQSCPLANSRYATVRKIAGKTYLYMKTAERAHLPSKLWERIKLSNNDNKALEQIDKHLQYWQKFLIHKCKQRYTRLMQIIARERKLELKDKEREYVTVKGKLKRRESTRERKALQAAKIEKSIENELVERLKSGSYGDMPLNVDEKIWKKAMNIFETETSKTEELNLELEDMDKEDITDDEIEYVEEEEEDFDIEDLNDSFGEFFDFDNKSKHIKEESEEEFSDEDGSKIKRVEVEYEHDFNFE